ncbi:amino acid adenylation domain-containing protein [Micromonospora sp. FIMYZ51]|uniref:amino acid adenylation domain-containing protein n=1 Tax=Micromonospora sp. FIMYZ51 TaxID=3051832 RepID=UPI00311E8E63
MTVNISAARTHPGRLAVISGSDRLTFADLDRRADAVAVALAARGVRRGDVVALRMERSAAMVTAVLGVLRSGAAYLPVDPAHPPRRQAMVIHESAAGHLITDLAAGPPDGVEVVDVGAALRGEVAADPEALAALPRPTGDDLAYVIFTSGSTGRPKGVLVPHKAVRALGEALVRCGAAGPGHDVVAWNASLSFDASVQQWVRLLRGDTLVLLSESERRDPADLVNVLRRHEVTDLDITPTHLRLLLPHLDRAGLPRLRLLVGGEAIDGELWNALAERRRTGRMVAFNVYGPTECTVDAVVARVGDSPEPVIGRPLPGFGARVVDLAGRDVPTGQRGELLLSGTGVSWGYLGRPASTALAFVPEPAGPPGSRAYRTGDMVRQLPGDALAYLGRRDHQIKIRGIRIELGEIEHELRGLPGVADAVALLSTTPDGTSQIEAAVAAPVEPDSWRSLLTAVLPAAAVPVRLLTLPTLPRNQSGKADRAAVAQLLAADAEASEAPDIEARLTVRQRYVAGVWADVFGARRLTADSEFTALGGHSLSAIVVADRVQRETGRRVTVADVLSAPTVAAFAELLDTLPAGPVPAAVPPAPVARRSAPLAPQQEGLYLLHQMYPHCSAYHVPALLRLDGPLDLDRLARAIATVVTRHAALRTRIGTVADRPVQMVTEPPTEPPLTVHRGDAANVTEWADEVVRRPFALDASLFRAEALITGDGVCHLALVGHHIVVDGWSMEVVQRDIGLAYRGELPAGEPVQFPAVAAALRSAGHRAEVSRQLEYWRDRLAGLPEPIRLPFTRRRPVTPRFRAGRVRRRLDATTAQALRRLAAAYRVPLFPLLTLGLAAVVHRLTGQQDLVLGTPVAGRDGAETSDSVGFFNNSLVLRLSLDPGRPVRDNLRTVARTIVDALANRHVPFDELVRELAPPRIPGANPIFQIWSNMLSYPISPPNLGDDVTVTTETAPVPGALFDLSAYFTDTADGVEVDLVHDADLFDEDRVQTLADDLVATFTAFRTDPDRPLADLRPDAPAVRSPWRTVPSRPAPATDAGAPCLDAGAPCLVAADAGAPCLVAADHTLTAAELRAAIDRCRADLDAADPDRRRPAAIVGARTPALVIALLAALTGNRPYLLIDADLPAARQQRMLTAVENPLRIAATARTPVVHPEPTPAPHGIAVPPGTGYVAFTSGSTGHPRPILASAAPLTALLRWYPETFAITANDRFSALSGVGHDPLLREILPALCAGATLHLPSPADTATPAALVAWLSAQRITVLHLSPTLGRLLAASGATLPTVRLVAFGGGPVHATDVTGLARLCPAARIVSHYGATETPQVAATVDHTTGTGFTTGTGPIVGTDSPTAELLLMDSHGRPAPANGAGEIWVRSPYLALGYLGDPASTARRFLPDPYGEPGVRAYRTGDLGLRRPDGTIEFRGRADRQISVHGNRVELDEIEAILREHPGVHDAVAYLDGEQLAAAASGIPELTPADLRRHLSAMLPPAVRPGELRVVGKIPLTGNGKPDVAALRRTGEPAPAAEALDADLAAVVTRVCTAAFGRTVIGPDVSFFEAGGTSLALIEVEARLSRALGRTIGLTTLFQNPTVHSLTKAIQEASR